MEVTMAVNQRWSMALVAAQLSNDRRFRVLNIVGEYYIGIVGQLVPTSISGEQVGCFLD